MFALQQVSVINPKAGNVETREEQSRNNSAVLGHPPGYSRDTHNIYIFEFLRNEGPYPGRGWNDDVDPPDFSQLKLGRFDLCPNSMLSFICSIK